MEKKQKGVGIIGVGKYIPQIPITNEYLSGTTGLSATEIFEKTGINCRYRVEENETATGMSAIAAQRAIDMAGIDPKEIGIIVCATFSNDYIYPAMACKVQELIGAENAGAYDILANCTGFQVALANVSDRMKVDDTIKYGLVLGTAIQSRYLDFSDINSALFNGDGSGAALLGKVPVDFGILDTEIFTNSKVFESVRLRGGGSSFRMKPENISEKFQYIEMNGIEVWKQVIQNQPRVIRNLLEKMNKKIEDVDFFIFHQANLRLIEYLMGKMKLPMEKTYVNVDKIGNTADASLAIALCDAVNENKIKKENLMVISGVGAGFTFGATAIRWY
jgi:3-oxoacyl-[acyl-carrier-protein] synthase III